MNPLAEMELEVPLRKLTDYLLSPTHPVGRHKARFFAALGFIRVYARQGVPKGIYPAENPLDLAEALKLQARMASEVQEEATPFGLKWAARGKLLSTGIAGPPERLHLGPRDSAGVMSVWIGEGCGGAEPCTRGQIPVGTATRYARARLVTAYPAEGGRG
ncbi:DUF6883 domain-containing protein [Calidithermus timidus]|uniref:DUF6883 domain-containing protein n=1 Tax=Calidithermus timidus TaxID=307124 RepID=UPI0003801582|nr:DUF6883 domain-containing protein [Calidithermus timidus]